MTTRWKAVRRTKKSRSTKRSWTYTVIYVVEVILFLSSIPKFSTKVGGLRSNEAHNYSVTIHPPENCNERPFIPSGANISMADPSASRPVGAQRQAAFIAEKQNAKKLSMSVKGVADSLSESSLRRTLTPSIALRNQIIANMPISSAQKTKYYDNLMAEAACLGTAARSIQSAPSGATPDIRSLDANDAGGGSCISVPGAGSFGVGGAGGG